ncbi:unnamed protein product [Soboliphyme baturini]|uniref:DUF2040 domain-containing protein n=1 Tax=Soboliphyme baturini TaxID=241478 RepID=A0A183IZM9_9BILA|nr:unnamed protein product [Soboliphyme baturini]
MASDDPPKYGLILRKSRKDTIRVKPSVFEDSEEEQLDEKTSKQRQDFSQRVKQQVSAQIEKALAEDPTTFQYDEVYETMTKERKDKKQVAQNEKSKEPKYALNLIRAAVKRQLENEVREERKQAKERLNEGDEFDDKEVFVTSAYRKRLEELRTFRAELESKDRIDEITDVTKQKDLSGFYRKLLHEIADPLSSKTGPLPSAAVDEVQPCSSVKTEDSVVEENAVPAVNELGSKDSQQKPELLTKDQHRVSARVAAESSDEEVDEELKKLVKSHSQKEKRPKESASERHRRFFTPSPPPQLQESRRKERRHSPSPPRSSSSKHRRHTREKSPRSFSRVDHNLHPPEEGLDRKSPAKIKVEDGHSDSDQKKKLIRNEVLGTVDPVLLKKQRLQKLREIFSHRNDAIAIEAYKQRYLERKRLRESQFPKTMV